MLTTRAALICTRVGAGGSGDDRFPTFRVLRDSCGQSSRRWP
jgi:hypothetical protein